jgi:hypothetical protein
MTVDSSASSIAFHFDLSQVLDIGSDQEILSASKIIGEVVDTARREFRDGPVQIETKDEPGSGGKSGFHIITDILITVAATARVIKPFIESICSLIGKLNERLPNSEFELTYPDGAKVRVKGKFGESELEHLAASATEHLRDTDLSAAKENVRPTYVIRLRP